MAHTDEEELVKKVVRDEFFRGKYATADEKRYLAFLTKNILESDLDVVYERLSKDFLSEDGLHKTNLRTLPKTIHGFAPHAWVGGSFGLQKGKEVLRVLNKETDKEGMFKLRTQGVHGKAKDMVRISCDDDELKTIMQSIVYQTDLDYQRAMERDKANPQPSRLTPQERQYVIKLIDAIRHEGFRFKQVHGGNIHTRPSVERDDLSAKEIADKCGRSLDVDTFIVIDPDRLRGGFFTINGHGGLGKADHVIESFKCDPEYQEDFETIIEQATGFVREGFKKEPESVIDTPSLG